MSDWCTIESDPGVFTELMESLGVEGVEVDELWSMDDDSLKALENLPVYGLIFLFKWQKEPPQVRDETPLTEVPDNLFFAKQVITNACATQAILSVLMNHSSDIKLGNFLKEFHSFTNSFPPDLLGEAIGASDEIRKSHNSFARRDAFLEEGKKRAATDDDDVFHFIAYVPVKDTVYELDGLQSGPIVIENDGFSSNNNDWLKVARTAIQKRMELYASSEIKFNLMAVMQDRRVGLRKALEEDPNSLQLQSDLAAQEAKRQAWKLENERRQHNYLPLCVELLKALAASGNMPQLVTEAKERVAAKRAKIMEAKKQENGGESKK